MEKLQSWGILEWFLLASWNQSHEFRAWLVWWGVMHEQEWYIEDAFESTLGRIFHERGGERRVLEKMLWAGRSRKITAEVRETVFWKTLGRIGRRL